MADYMQQLLEDLGLEQGRKPFDPEGAGYDYATARLRGYSPKPVPHDTVPHWQTRAPLTPQEAASMQLPEDSGMILKGRAHPTYGLGVAEDTKLGYRQVYMNGRWYSVKP